MDTIQYIFREFQSLYDILYIIVPIVVGIVIYVIKKSAGKKNKEMDICSFTISQGKVVTWIGIIGAMVFLALIVLMTIFPNDTAALWVYIVFSAFILLGVYIAVYSVSWEVNVTGNEIRLRALFKKTKTFTFDQIKTVKVRTHPNYGNQTKLVLYSDTEKLMYVESHCIGYDLFLTRLQNEGIELTMTNERYGL